jgi:hypothetical protein
MSADGIELAADFELEMRDMKRELVVRQGHCSIVPYGTFYDEIRSGELCAHTSHKFANDNSIRRADQVAFSSVVKLKAGACGPQAVKTKTSKKRGPCGPPDQVRGPARTQSHVFGS